MKPTANESADLMQALKHDPVTGALRDEAKAFPVEADQAIADVEGGLDTAHPQSWVAEWIAGTA